MSDLQTTEEKCSALDDTISEMNSVKAKVGVDSSEVDRANTIIQYCVAQKQELEAPAVMNVDVSQVSGKIGEVVGLLARVPDSAEYFADARNIRHGHLRSPGKC
ncbi:MAG: hypothetical protein ACLUTU_04225 [Blautia faecis]